MLPHWELYLRDRPVYSHTCCHMEKLYLRADLFIQLYMLSHWHTVSQGQTCLHNYTCCHTEKLYLRVRPVYTVIHAATFRNCRQNFPFHPVTVYSHKANQSSTDPITPGTWQGSHKSISCYVCLLVACLTSQELASVSQGQFCTDNFTCCNTHIEVADQSLYLTQSQYTDTGPTTPSTTISTL